MGTSRSESNWSDALTTRASRVGRSLSWPRWVVATVKALRAVSSRRIAWASAPPSTGSVPLPISSISTSDSKSALSSVSRRFLRCAEKVESEASMDCSSPMSACTPRKTGSFVPGPTGGTTPLWVRREMRPIAFRSTVFPPVLGPEMRSVRSPCSIRRSKGTTASSRARRSGWRPCTTTYSSVPAGSTSGTEPSYRAAKRARAWRVSSRTRISSEPTSSSRCGRRRSVRSRRMRWSSRASAASSSRSRFIISIAAGGSMKRVAPLPDSSWTIPPTSPRPSRRTGMT